MMKFLFLLLLPLSTFANKQTIVVEDTYSKCSEKLPETLFERMKDLSTLSEVDNIAKDQKNKMKLLGITLIDMVQSKQRVSKTNRPGALSNNDLLIVLRPLPKMVELPRELLPRFIIQCSTFQKNEFSTLKCDQVNQKQAFGVENFTMSLSFRKHPKDKKSCPTQIGIKYYVEISKSDFKKITDKSYELMKTGGIVKLIINLFADPKLFFKTYWEGFYDHWISASN